MLKLPVFTIESVQEEVRTLVTKGSVNRQNHLYELAKHFGYREWHEIEALLESHDYLLRDHVIDLVGQDRWVND